MAFRRATELEDRGPEIELLDRLGRLAHERARYDDAARYHQRALVLAEAVFNHSATIAASTGLGRAALARDELDGARAWFMRALRQAESATVSDAIGVLEHQLGAVLWRQGDVAGARTRLRKSRERLEADGAHGELARVLCTLGQFECEDGHVAEAIAAGREAVAWAQRGGSDSALTIEVMLCVAQLYVSAGVFVDAEHTLRQAEKLAIARQDNDRLIEVYVALGTLAGRQGDETGFVFFEEAASLCRGLTPHSALEARTFEEYGNFRFLFGEREEAAAHFERARQIFEAAGDRAALARLRDEVDALTA
jgi:tetratricopeptide (TPR) repeat protein